MYITERDVYRILTVLRHVFCW